MRALPPHCDQNMEKVPDLLPYDVKYAPHIRTAESNAGALLIHFLFWMTGMLTVMGRPEFLFDACVLSLLLFCFSHSICGSQCDVCRSVQDRQLLDFQIENAVFFFFFTCWPLSVSYYAFMHLSFSCSCSVFP